MHVATNSSHHIAHMRLMVCTRRHNMYHVICLSKGIALCTSQAVLPKERRRGGEGGRRGEWEGGTQPASQLDEHGGKP